MLRCVIHYTRVAVKGVEKETAHVCFSALVEKRVSMETSRDYTEEKGAAVDTDEGLP